MCPIVLTARCQRQSQSWSPKVTGPADTRMTAERQTTEPHHGEIKTIPHQCTILEYLGPQAWLWRLHPVWVWWLDWQYKLSSLQCSTLVSTLSLRSADCKTISNEFNQGISTVSGQIYETEFQKMPLPKRINTILYEPVFGNKKTFYSYMFHITSLIFF